MGMFLNPGADLFEDARASRIYVDKSAMIGYLNSVVNTLQKYVCVSRPRRFGKTMAANMVGAYYDRTVDGREAFSGMRIAADPSFEKERNRYDVIRLNMQAFLSATHEVGKLIAKIHHDVMFDFSLAYPDLRFRNAGSLIDSMADAYAQTGRRFVIIIDEWDCVMREMQSAHDQQERYLDFLRAWLKDQPYVALCYMTGILPIKKYGTHSALNMFDEFSMVAPDDMADYMGFTQAEVADLCRHWNVDLRECEAWYDGYRLQGIRGNEVEAYSPRSVVRAMTTGRFGSYWNMTESYEALKRYINMDMDGLHGKIVELMAGARIRTNVNTYVNDMTTFATADDVLTLLVHLGYLGYDSVTGETFIPNREVLGEFANSVESGDGWGEIVRSIRGSESLLEALIAGDGKAVAEGVERAHEDASSIIAYNDENALACTLRLAFFSAIRRWRIVRETPAGKGFADVMLVPLASNPELPGIVIELKHGATAHDALAQIHERGYARGLARLVPSGRIMLCGIAYDPKTKTHSCMIERV